MNRKISLLATFIVCYSSLIICVERDVDKKSCVNKRIKLAEYPSLAKNSKQQFFDAIVNGDEAMMEELIDDLYDTYAEKGHTWVSIGALQKAFKPLGIDPYNIPHHSYVHRNMGPVDVAAFHGKTQMVRRLLQKQGNNCHLENYTGFVLAMDQGYYDIAQLIGKHNVNQLRLTNPLYNVHFSIKDLRKGQVSKMLTLAILRRQPQTLQALLSSGAQLKYYMEDPVDEDTPSEPLLFHLAASQGQDGILQQLIDHENAFSPSTSENLHVAETAVALHKHVGMPHNVVRQVLEYKGLETKDKQGLTAIECTQSLLEKEENEQRREQLAKCINLLQARHAGLIEKWLR